MARQAIPIATLEAMIHDVTDALETIQNVVRDMQASGMSVCCGR